MVEKLTIGQLITGDASRDAIHVAIAPVEAATRLYPGQDIGLVSAGVAGVTAELLGIVDPFLKQPVQPGELFYMFLYPNSITSLRHEWTHAAFERAKPTVTPKVAAEERLKTIAQVLDMTYSQLMAAAANWVEYEDYTIEHGSEHWRNSFSPAMAREFWDAYEVVTGTTVKDKEAQFFSCSC